MADFIETQRARAEELFRRARRNRLAGREALAQAVERRAALEIAKGLQAVEAQRAAIMRLAEEAKAQAIADFEREHGAHGRRAA